MQTWTEQLEAGLGDGSCDWWTAVWVEEAPLAEDEHKVPKGGDEQTVRYCPRSAWGHLHLGCLHGAARIHYHHTGLSSFWN